MVCWSKLFVYYSKPIWCWLDCVVEVVDVYTFGTHGAAVIWKKNNSNLNFLWNTKKNLQKTKSFFLINELHRQAQWEKYRVKLTLMVGRGLIVPALFSNSYFSMKKRVFLIHYELSENIFLFFHRVLGRSRRCGHNQPPPPTQATTRSPLLLGLRRTIDRLFFSSSVSVKVWLQILV